MIGVQDIFLAGEKIGSACIERDGLYYRFHCRCELSGEILCRLVLVQGDRKENLGIPVPQNGAFECKTRIPMKKLGSGQWKIWAVPKQEAQQGKFVPLSPQEPFRYLKQLNNAYLQVRGEQVGIVIPQR